MPQITFRPHNDEPDGTILPQRAALVAQVIEVLGASKPPQVFGIDGDWGAGKTSLLLAIERQLTGATQGGRGRSVVKPPERYKHIKVVWFEAWRYQHESAPVIALLHEICAQLSLAQKSKRGLRKLAFAGFYGLINTIKEASIETTDLAPFKFGVNASNPLLSIARSGEKWESDNFETPLTTEHTRSLLDNAIKALLGWSDINNARVLIIVDDLDRCEPAAAYRILEAIKIYLNLESCVFLLGLNQREVIRAVGSALTKQRLSSARERREATNRGSEYLEKLCSVVWHIPLISKSDLTNLLRSLLRPKNENNICTDANSLSEHTVNVLIELVVEYRCVPGIPRKIKAWVNNLRNLVSLTESGGDGLAEVTLEQEKLPALVIATGLTTFHPQIVLHLQESSRVFDELISYADSLRIASDFAKTSAFENLIMPAGSDAATLPSEHPEPSAGNVFRMRELLRREANSDRAGLYDKLAFYLSLPARTV